MHRKVLLFLAILIFYTPVLAQKKIKPPKKEKQVLDSTYIRKYPNFFTVGLFISSPILEVRLYPLEDSLSRYNIYKGNLASSVGISLGYKGISGSFGFRTSPEPSSVNQKGESSFRNLQLKFRFKGIYASAHTSRFTGFYDENSRNSYGSFEDSNQVYAIRPDITYKQRIFSLTTNFSYKKYSYSGPYTYTERQIKSRAGFLLRGSLGHIQLKGDSSLIHGLQRDAFSTFRDIKKLNAFMIKGGPGVGFNIVVFKRFYFASTLFIQFNTVIYQFTNESNKITKIGSSISSFAEGSFGIGYNAKKLFMGIHLNGISNRIKFGDAKFETANGTLSLDLGIRIESNTKKKK